MKISKLIKIENNGRVRIDTKGYYYFAYKSESSTNLNNFTGINLINNKKIEYNYLFSALLTKEVRLHDSYKNAVFVGIVNTRN